MRKYALFHIGFKKKMFYASYLLFLTDLFSSM